MTHFPGRCTLCAPPFTDFALPLLSASAVRRIFPVLRYFLQAVNQLIQLIVQPFPFLPGRRIQSAASIGATPHCGDRLFRLTSALTKLLPPAVVRASPSQHPAQRNPPEKLPAATGAQPAPDGSSPGTKPDPSGQSPPRKTAEGISSSGNPETAGPCRDL